MGGWHGQVPDDSYPQLAYRDAVVRPDQGSDQVRSLLGGDMETEVFGGGKTIKVDLPDWVPSPQARTTPPREVVTLPHDVKTEITPKA